MFSKPSPGQGPGLDSQTKDKELIPSQESVRLGQASIWGWG